MTPATPPPTAPPPAPGGPRPLRAVGPDELAGPIIDDVSRAVLDEAVEALARLRTPYWLGDSGVRLHALASLLAQAHALLPDTVHDARDQDLTWTEIGQLLGLTADTAARRYRPHQ
jgi:hypothetical protein